MIKKEKIKYIVIAIIILLTGVIYSFFVGNTDNGDDTALQAQFSDEEMSETTNTDEIFVYVCGYVVNPGVYKVSTQARIYEVIDMAGGITPEGTVDNLNLAQIVSDGEKITISSINTTSDNTEESDSLVNINTASKEELMTLPGIGESKASAIISYRQDVAAFSSVSDIMNVTGIKEAAYSKIKELIKV